MTTKIEAKCGHVVEVALVGVTHADDAARKSATRKLCPKCRDEEKRDLAAEMAAERAELVAEGFDRTQALSLTNDHPRAVARGIR